MENSNGPAPCFPVPPEIWKQARWIWPESFSHDIYNGYAQFRREFDLGEAPPPAAWAMLTADQSYKLYVNGGFVCRGPARGYQESWPVDTVDLAPFLRRGRNVIAIRAYNPGCSSFQYRSEDYAGFFFAARFAEQCVVSGRSWKARRQTGVRRDTEPSSLQLFPQEHIDIRIEPPDWMSPDFDDSGWAAPSVSTAWNSLPWSSLEERGIPLLREDLIPIGPPIATGEGQSAEGWAESRNVLALRQGEGFRFARSESVRAHGGGLEIEPSAEGRFRTFLFDLGKVHVGNLSLNIAGARGGETIDFAYSETIDPETLVPHFSDPDVRLGSRMICRPGEFEHAFFHPYACRYLVLTVREAVVPLRLGLAIQSAKYPLALRGTFHHSDDTLNRIWDACSWTQQICSLDAYIDTPWREQAQWWGDARVQAWNTFHLCPDARLLRRGIRIMAGQMTNTGLIYGHAPTKAHSCVVPDFALIWLLTLWDYYWQTGDSSLIGEFEQPIRRILAYFKEKTEPRYGLVAHDPRYWLFLDWADLFRNGYSTVLTLWLILALGKLEELSGLAGCQSQWRDLRPWRESLAAGVSELAREGLIRDGRAWNGEVVAGASIHTQTLALEAGIRPDLRSSMLSGSLLPFIRGETPRSKWPSIYWMAYVFNLLSREGFESDVLRFIRGSREEESAWAVMARHGSTWSQFGNYGGRHSHSHAWSAHPLYHLMQILGGIRQQASAWREITFRPLFRGTHADVCIPSPQGLIRCAWRRDDSEIRVRLDLPKPVNAKVRLPGVVEERTGGTHFWVIPSLCAPSISAGSGNRHPSC